MSSTTYYYKAKLIYLSQNIKAVPNACIQWVNDISCPMSAANKFQKFLGKIHGDFNIQIKV